MLATLPLLLTFAAAPISPDGGVATPEGVRFRLPPGFSYATRAIEGTHAYVAEARDHRRGVIVAAAFSDAELDCEGGGVRPHRTRRGLRGCLVVGGPAGGAAVLLVKRGATLVAVTAVAAAGQARTLATSVGDSIEIDEAAAAPARGLRATAVARADPRLVGCFDEGWATSSPGDSALGDGGTKRCFEADLTFTEERIVNVVIPGVGGASRVTQRAGTWRFSGGVLTLSYEDGRQVTRRIEFLRDPDDGLLADGNGWERL